MSEPHTLTIKGQVFTLPPWNAGQMRRQVDPVLRKTKEILETAMAIQDAATPSPVQIVDLALKQREIVDKHAELVLMALQNQYPHLTMDDVDTLTPGQISQVFNLLVFLSTSGGSSLGELIPPSL